MQKAIKFIKDNIDSEHPIVIGVSGGPDSMCLLELLLQCKKQEQIICAHVNHNIRKESKEELQFVENYCKEKGVCFESVVLKSNKKDSEVILRKKRYVFFKEVIKKHNAKYLLTAHHGDDLIETVLMRMTRGSNLKGYAGIEAMRKEAGFTVLRPLLSYSKEEITAYNQKHNIPFVIDSSNESSSYTRNRYRKVILPFLKGEEKQIEAKYLQYSAEVLKYYHFVDEVVKKQMEIHFRNEILYLDDFLKMDKLIQEKMLEKVLHHTYGDAIELVTGRHIQLILQLIVTKANGFVSLPQEKIAVKNYNELHIKNKMRKKNATFHYILDKRQQVPTGIIEYTKDRDDNSNYCIKLDSKEIAFPIHVRSRKNGDKMKVKHLNGYKKVKDILIDEKISLALREEIPIVTDNNDLILWIPGVKKSEFDKSKQKNYDIIIKYTENCTGNKKEKTYE